MSEQTYGIYDIVETQDGSFGVVMGTANDGKELVVSTRLLHLNIAISKINDALHSPAFNNDIFVVDTNTVKMISKQPRG